MSGKLLTCLLSTIITITSCSAAIKTVEYPTIGEANSQTLDFVKVELSDTATRITTKAYYRPNYWIRISSNAIIESNGKRYPLKRAEGFPLDKEYFMPESGETEFTLVFDPMPLTTEKFSFKEDPDDAASFMVWDVDLTSSTHDPFCDLPIYKEISQSSATMLPEVKLSADSITATIHLYPYHSDMGDELSYCINTLHGQETYPKPVQIDGNGIATIKFFTAGPIQIMFREAGSIPVNGLVSVMPGEKIDIYLNTHVSGASAMLNRDKNGDGSINMPRFVHNGICGPMDAAIMSSPNFYTFNMYNGHFADYHMSADEYIDHITKLYKTNCAAINSDNTLSELAKKAWTNNITADLLYATDNAYRLIYHNYWCTYDCYGSPVPADSIPAEFYPEHYRLVANLVNMNDPQILLTNRGTNPAELGSYTWAKAGIDAPLFTSIACYKDAYEKACAGNLTDEMLDSIRPMINPAFAKELELKREEVAKIISQIPAELVSPTPDVAPDKVLDAIVAPYKGKVVVIDLWNTWCGPCRGAIARHEPHKASDFPAEEVEWIYIADESSPLSTYYDMIPGIKGRHYIVDEATIAAIRNRFGVDGIPYYILVDREGNISGRPDFRDDKVYRSAILDAISR